MPPEITDRLTGYLRAARVLSVVAADAEGRVTDWSEGARRMLGYRSDEVVGSADP